MEKTIKFSTSEIEIEVTQIKKEDYAELRKEAQELGFIINQTDANYFRALNEPRDEEDAAKTLNLLEDAGYSFIS